MIVTVPLETLVVKKKQASVVANIALSHNSTVRLKSVKTELNSAGYELMISTELFKEEQHVHVSRSITIEAQDLFSTKLKT